MDARDEPKPSRRTGMTLPSWAQPNNWSEETRTAAKAAAKTAAILIISILRNSRYGNELCRIATQKLPQLMK
jgi:hypothetical protein